MIPRWTMPYAVFVVVPGSLMLKPYIPKLSSARLLLNRFGPLLNKVGREFCHAKLLKLVTFFFPLQPPPPARPTPESLISVHFGSVSAVSAQFGSVSGPFRVHFGSVSGCWVGLGWGRGKGLL